MKVVLEVTVNEKPDQVLKYTWNEDARLFVIPSPYEAPQFTNENHAEIIRWEELRQRRRNMLEALGLKIAEAMMQTIEAAEQVKARKRIQPIK